MRGMWRTLASYCMVLLHIAWTEEVPCAQASFDDGCSESRQSSSLLQHRFQRNEARTVLESGAVCDGVAAVGRCWYMSDVGGNCDTTCAVHGFKYNYADPGEDMTPRLLGFKPGLRQEPWIFVECYVPDEDRYHPSNPNSWGVPEKTPVNEWPEIGQHSYGTCALACPCASTNTPAETSPEDIASVEASDFAVAATTSAPSPPPVVTETTSVSVASGPHCTDGVGLAAEQRCWYLSDTGTSCAATCAAQNRTYLFAAPTEDMVPKLLGRSPAIRQEAWIFLECYVFREDRYHPFNPEAWGVPAKTPGEELPEAGLHSYPTCRLACPCSQTLSTARPAPSSTVTMTTTSAITATTTTSTIQKLGVVVKPVPKDGVRNCSGRYAAGRCWYLSDLGANCDDTCAAYACDYSFSAPPPGDMVPLLLKKIPDSRLDPWMFVECYVPELDRYYPFNRNAWGVPGKTPTDELTNVGKYSSENCRLSCPCQGRCIGDVSPAPAPEPEPEPEPEPVKKIPNGAQAYGRNWYLSEVGANCADTCAANGLSYKWMAPPEGKYIIPQLLGKEPSNKQSPWAFLECYVPEGDRYRPVSRNAWGVPGRTPFSKMTPARWSAAECRLACPCSTASTPCRWEQPAACAPEFQWKGQLFRGCATVDNDKPWCMHNSEMKGPSSWSECIYTCDEQENDTPDQNCNWTPSPTCVQEFDYEGSHYIGCASIDHNSPWCSNSQPFAGSWSHCTYACKNASEADTKTTITLNQGATNDSSLCSWQPPPACAPKFRYMSTEYEGCAMWAGHPTPWCSHDRSHAGAWSNCERICTSSSV